jgi:hypothetical protein
MRRYEILASERDSEILSRALSSSGSPRQADAQRDCLSAKPARTNDKLLPHLSGLLQWLLIWAVIIYAGT